MLLEKIRKGKDAFNKKATLYGVNIGLLLVFKAIMRKCLRISWEKCYLMSRDLTGIESPEIRSDLEVRELKLEDYKSGGWKAFLDNEKHAIYEQRFLNGKAKAYGAFINGYLVYSTWILYGEVVYSERFILFQSPDYGLLLDTYCHPDFRGKGVHNYMNQWRLDCMRNHGVRKGYVIVLSYNRPAIKTQIKCGLSVEQTFYSFRVGKWQYCTMTTYQKKNG